MNIIFDPSVPVGVDRPWLTYERALATRVRMVLETRPGQIPWRPEFGCDLDGLVGRAANAQLLNQARWRVEAALKRWLPDAEVETVEVHAVIASTRGSMLEHREVPVAEAALLTVGVQAALQVSVEVRGPDGSVAVAATLEP